MWAKQAFYWNKNWRTHNLCFPLKQVYLFKMKKLWILPLRSVVAAKRSRTDRAGVEKGCRCWAVMKSWQGSHEASILARSFIVPLFGSDFQPFSPSAPARSWFKQREVLVANVSLLHTRTTNHLTGSPWLRNDPLPSFPSHYPPLIASFNVNLNKAATTLHGMWPRGQWSTHLKHALTHCWPSSRL